MLVAGEASGDRYAAEIFRELKALIPGVRGIGMGGQNMARAGVEIRYDSTDIAVIGVGEAIKHYRKIKRALGLMQRIACQERPDLLICVDYKEFNFALAGTAKTCGITVLFYVSPQVWAWRPGRVRKYGKVIDMMAVIFPFEEAFYQQYKIPVRFVGHPLVDRVGPSLPRVKALETFALDPSKPVVGLFPGSRENEVRRLLPLMLDAAKRITARQSDVQFVLSGDFAIDAFSTARIQSSAVKITVIKGQIYDLMNCCAAIMIASGTATLEAALMGTPMVISYKVTPLTYLIGKLLIKIPYIGLPNILANKGIVKEFLQRDATPENLASEIERILTDKTYAQEMRAELRAVGTKLGKGGGTANVAKLAAEMLSNQHLKN